MAKNQRVIYSDFDYPESAADWLDNLIGSDLGNGEIVERVITFQAIARTISYGINSSDTVYETIVLVDTVIEQQAA